MTTAQATGTWDHNAFHATNIGGDIPYTKSSEPGAITITDKQYGVPGPTKRSEVEKLVASMDRAGAALALALTRVEFSVSRLLGDAPSPGEVSEFVSGTVAVNHLAALRERVAKLQRQADRAHGLAERLAPIL